MLTKQETLLGRAPGWRAGGQGNPGELFLRFLCLESTLFCEKPKGGLLSLYGGGDMGGRDCLIFFYLVLRIF